MVDQCPLAAANRLVGQADHARRNYGRCNWRVPWHAAGLAKLAQAEQFLAPVGRNRTRLKKSGRSARRGGSLEVTRETVEEVGSLDASRVRRTRLSRREQISAVRNRTFAITYHRKLIPGASWCAHDLALRRPEGAAGSLALKSEPGRPMTLCCPRSPYRLVRGLRPQVEPVPAELARRYGAEMTLPDWRERSVCSKCGSREIATIMSGTERRRK